MTSQYRYAVRKETASLHFLFLCMYLAIASTCVWFTPSVLAYRPCMVHDIRSQLKLDVSLMSVLCARRLSYQMIMHKVFQYNLHSLQLPNMNVRRTKNPHV